ncbi:dynein heavy chain, partial [Coemansia sp. RSA 2703]
VPGLFDGDELAALLTACREGAARDGLLLDSAEELQRWFATQVARNLHVVFTMNPPSDMNARAATSPALFNRCVVDWFGDWSDQALYQVGREFTQAVDLDDATWEAPASLPLAFTGLPQPIVHRTAVANALVAAHKAVRSVSVRLAARRGVVAHVTPRHYLDFIAHFARLYWARRGALEEQQRHVNVGLARLADTVAQVEALRGTLSAKRAALAAKTAQADAALQQMVGDQQAAERSQAASLALQAELAEQNAAIAERRAVVVRDLERAEPAVEDAQRAVSGIKKQHLTEVRAMANPPAAVKLALECVCTLLGHVTADWKAIQGVVRRDDFIASIVRFDADRQLPRAQRAHVRRTFLERPEFNFETVSRASKACGPLVKWAIAQVEYADILERVGPLRAEVAALEAQAAASQEQAAQLAQTLGSLEASIARYKTEYAALIGETEALKAEMARVEATVARSVALLESLGAERARWAAGSAAFDAQMATLVGDVLLGAALLAYGGFYAQRERAALARRWLAHMQASGLAVSEAAVAAGTGAGTGSLVALVASADEQLAWGVDADGDTDALALENAAMLAHHNRYPLIIDPTGGAEAAVRRVVGADATLAVTSFLDPAFLKHVEAALRFGNAVVVGDAEHFDAVLNPLLNRELRRTGGRVLVRLGTQDVDCSPAFRLFLATRDASAVFAPDVASRVTFVNYTVTRASLQAQCLAHVMRCERPDVAERRREQARLQGALRARMHALERELLQALSRSQGSVLDDDAVVATLETLKTEAAEVARKTAETEGVLLEVERVAAAYTPLARASAAVFFALERLAALHGFYQFSLEFFVGSVFARVVEHNGNLHGVTDERARLAVLRRDLFALAFRRAAVSLHHARRLALLVQLAQIKLRLDEDEAASAAASAPASQEAWAQLNADLDYALRADWEAEGGLAAAARVRPWCRGWLDAPDAASQLLAAGDDELLAAGGESVDFG